VHRCGPGDSNHRGALRLTSPFGPAFLICNARAGRGGAGRALPEVRRRLDERALDHDVVFTTGPGDATKLARSALEDGARFIVAMGGDGTLHEVLNGMITDDSAVVPEAVLGVVAAGTGCDFVRTFGMPALPAHAVAHLDGHECFSIDIGKATVSRDGAEAVAYFHNIAQAGLGAEVARLARRLPAALGPMLYPVAFWMRVARWRAAEGTVDLVDRSYRGRLSNVIVANCQFFGRGMKIAPKAVPTDGLLDVLVDHASKTEQIAAMPRVYRGEHLPHPDVLEAKRVRVSVAADRPLLVEADGELLGRTPATFEVLPNAVRLKV
jgi:diacylglycerol kinase (ATP)